MNTILVADDSNCYRYLTRFLLEQRGYQVHEAHDGEEAVAAVRQNAYDLVLMDVQMPKLDGLEATRRIKAGADAPPIVALTGKDTDDDRKNILTAGCDGYIEKPIDAQVLVTQVDAFLESVAYRV